MKLSVSCVSNHILIYCVLKVSIVLLEESREIIVHSLRHTCVRDDTTARHQASGVLYSIHFCLICVCFPFTDIQEFYELMVFENQSLGRTHTHGLVGLCACVCVCVSTCSNTNSMAAKVNMLFVLMILLLCFELTLLNETFGGVALKGGRSLLLYLARLYCTPKL